jgi:acyl-CoA thioesterase-2
MSELADLLQRLDLAADGPDSFVGTSPPVAWNRVFGGLVVAQALVAASRTVDNRAPHSLHAYFLLPGDPAKPIHYAVERLRDGRSFSVRRVVAHQADRTGRMAAIFALSCSFHLSETGHEHQAAMPMVPAPETLPSEQDLIARHGDRLSDGFRRYLTRQRPIEMRATDPLRLIDGKKRADARQAIWMRARGPLPDDPAVHRAVLAYASDMTLLDTALVPHGTSVFQRDIQAASLDHALWFHRRFRADRWFLYAQDSPSAAGARGLTRGLIFQDDGTLIAATAQEGLIRPVTAQASD